MNPPSCATSPRWGTGHIAIGAHTDFCFLPTQIVIVGFDNVLSSEKPDRRFSRRTSRFGKH